MLKRPRESRVTEHNYGDTTKHRYNRDAIIQQSVPDSATLYKAGVSLGVIYRVGNDGCRVMNIRRETLEQGHLQWRLEHYKSMSVVMCVHPLADLAQVDRAVSATVPLAVDACHTAVA